MELSKTQINAIDDLEHIITSAKSLISKLESNQTDGIDAETMHIYKLIDRLDYWQ